MKYRKKPVVIEAFIWTFGCEIPKCAQGKIAIECEAFLLINTLEGAMTANSGDFVIRGVEGEVYPCKPGIFEKTYEWVEA